MKQNYGIAFKIWDIVYPVCMYYAAVTIGITVAQFLFGTGNEHYMLCKIIGSLLAIPVVYAEYRHDLMLEGRYGAKPQFTMGKAGNLLLVIGITLCVSVALNNLISMSPLIEMSEEFKNASNALYGSSIGWELLGSALITPVLEELLHRGVVYGRLRRMMGLWSAVILSSLIFAILHFNMIQFIYTFLIGIIFAIFVEKTGHLYPAIIAHMVANALAVFRTESGFLAKTVDGSAGAWIISVTLGVVGLVGILLYSKALMKKES